MNKATLIFVLATIAIIGGSLFGLIQCSKQQKKEAEEYAEWQKQRQIEIEDSIAKVDGDSIIGPYKFGMSKHDVDSIWRSLEASVPDEPRYKEYVRQYFIVGNWFLLSYPNDWFYVNGKLAMMELVTTDQENNDNPYWHDNVPFSGERKSRWETMRDSLEHVLERKYGENRDSTYKSHTYGMPHKAYQIVESNNSNSRIWVGVMKMRIFRPSLFGKNKYGEYGYIINYLDDIERSSY